MAQVLRAAREKANLSQAELAEGAGLVANHVARLERGDKAYPRFETIARLAGELGLSLDAIAAECGIPGFTKGTDKGTSLRRSLTAIDHARARLAETSADLELVSADLQAEISESRKRR